MKAAASRPRKRREGGRERYAQKCTQGGRRRHGPPRPGRGRLFWRPVRSAEMDRRYEEEARWTHTGAAGSEALRILRVQRRQHALALPAARRGRPGLPEAEYAAQPRIPREFFARHPEDGGHFQGGQ